MTHKEEEVTIIPCDQGVRVLILLQWPLVRRFLLTGHRPTSSSLQIPATQNQKICNVSELMTEFSLNISFPEKSIFVLFCYSVIDIKYLLQDIYSSNFQLEHISAIHKSYKN